MEDILEQKIRKYYDALSLDSINHRRKLMKLPPIDEIGGFTFNEDLSSLRAIVFKDGQIFEHVYRRDKQDEDYVLIHISCAGRLSL